jgi:hypothetical protein
MDLQVLGRYPSLLRGFNSSLQVNGGHNFPNPSFSSSHLCVCARAFVQIMICMAMSRLRWFDIGSHYKTYVRSQVISRKIQGGLNYTGTEFSSVSYRYHSTIVPYWSLWSLRCAIIFTRQHIVTSLVSYVGSACLAQHLVGYRTRNLTFYEING